MHPRHQAARQFSDQGCRSLQTAGVGGPRQQGSLIVGVEALPGVVVHHYQFVADRDHHLIGANTDRGGFFAHRRNKTGDHRNGRAYAAGLSPAAVGLL